MIDHMTTVGQLRAWAGTSEENQRIFQLCFPRRGPGAPLPKDAPLWELGERRCAKVLSAFRRVMALQEEGKTVCRGLYTQEEIAADPTKKEAAILLFPGEKENPFVLVLPGGGYQMVAVLDEGVSDALALNALGYSAVVLNYRVGIENIMPRPVEDLARAVQTVMAMGEAFPCRKDGYLLAGFSSGGHLAGMWASKAYGYCCYGLPAPEAVFAGYPLVSVSQRAWMYRYGLGTKGELRHIQSDLLMLYGPREDYEDIAGRYDIHRLVDESWPPCYLIHGLEDSAVYFNNSELWAAALEKYGVAHVLRLVERAGHGFGTGAGTEADGWFADAIAFWKETKQ